jgi:hypothetical protein
LSVPQQQIAHRRRYLIVPPLLGRVNDDPHRAFPVALLECCSRPLYQALLGELKALTNLRELCIGFTKVTDQGIKELEALKGLEWLHLGSTEVTDAALRQLKGFKSLRTVIVRGSNKITDEGIKELQAARPELEIRR